MVLIEELTKRGILDKEKAASLENEIKDSGRREEEVILENKAVPEDVLFNIKSEYLKIPLKKMPAEEATRELLELIPEETAKYYKMVPLAKKGNLLEVGMVYPEDLDSQEAVKFLARKGKFNFQIFLITPENFASFIRQYRALKKEVAMVLQELENEMKGEKMPEVEEIERLVEEAPITKTVAVILRYGVEGRASDIHIEPIRDKLRIRFRLLGALHSSIFLPISVLPAVVARIKILSNLKIDEGRVPQDGRFSARIEDKEIDFRVSTFPTSKGEKVAIRILDPTTGLKRLEDLGLSERNFSAVQKAIDKPYGMILVTGPTGCGKSTTLYSILQILNKDDVNIITLEDPVEYFIEGVNQSQIRPEINYTFATGLRHILRQDPDIIMVGEIRDEETAALATHAALTGHIVLSTLHTNNALGVVPRLVDLGVQPFLIPPTLSVALAQRLVRKLCSKCKKKIKPRKEIRDLILKELEVLPEKNKYKEPIYVWEPGSCKECHNTGFSGRMALIETLEMTEDLSNIILKDPSENAIQDVAKKQGMTTMRQDGIVKVMQGVTTIEEVLRETTSY